MRWRFSGYAIWPSRAILRRTLAIVRHFQRKTHLVRLPWLDEPSGEIALLETIDAAPNPLDIQPEDIRVLARREKPLDPGNDYGHEPVDDRA